MIDHIEPEEVDRLREVEGRRDIARAAADIAHSEFVTFAWELAIKYKCRIVQINVRTGKIDRASETPRTE